MWMKSDILTTMASVLDSQLALLERETVGRPDAMPAERAAAVADLVALHTAVYEEVMERRLGDHGLTEAHRPLVPQFRRWIETARRVVAAARDLRAAGESVAGVDDLVRAINRAKPVVEAFDETVSLNQRIARGEAGTYRPLAEVMDELRSKPQPPR